MKGLYMRLSAALLVVVLCGCAPAGGGQSLPPPETSQPRADTSSAVPQEGLLENPLLYEADGYTVALPREWEGRVLINVDELQETELISVHEKESYEQSLADWKSQGAGFLFGFVAYDQVEYEEYLCREGTGLRIFARDQDYYYGEQYPTDVQYYRSGVEFLYEGEGWNAWLAMVDQIEAVKQDFIARNGLQEYDGSELYDRDFTYDGEHRYVACFSGDGDALENDRVLLVLSQPVKQGEGGVWCVERCFHDSVTQWFYSFPTESGMAAADYYPMLQSRADAGEDTTHLTSEGAARAWAENAYQEHVILFSPQSFQVLDDVPAGEPHKYAQKLLMQPGRFGWVSDGELIHTGACPDGASGGLYRSLTQTPWAVPEGVSVDEGNLVYYETENGDRLEIYDSGIVMITQEGDTRIYQPMWNNDNGEVYNEAVLWVTSLETQSEL